MPDDGPFHRQALQINQTILADWSGFPSIVADPDFCAVRLGNDLLIRGKSKHKEYPAILFPQLLQSIFVAFPSPTIEECHPHDANDQGEGSSSYSTPTAKSAGNVFLNDTGYRDYKHHGQQFDQSVCRPIR